MLAAWFGVCSAPFSNVAPNCSLLPVARGRSSGPLLWAVLALGSSVRFEVGAVAVALSVCALYAARVAVGPETVELRRPVRPASIRPATFRRLIALALSPFAFILLHYWSLFAVLGISAFVCGCVSALSSTIGAGKRGERASSRGPRLTLAELES